MHGQVEDVRRGLARCTSLELTAAAIQSSAPMSARIVSTSSALPDVA